MASKDRKLVFLIIGCSTGFGQEIATRALSCGHDVIATSRNASKLSALADRGACTTSLDVRSDDATVTSIINTAAAHYSNRIDILVNNAGYILVGGIDEPTDAEAKAQFDVNYFGLLKVIRAVLPIMRKARSGVIANMGSIAGWRGTQIAGHYCATKFAIAGITESLRAENEQFGIECTCVDPGYFRTQFLSEDARTEAKKHVEDLAELSGQMRETFKQINGRQPGDPRKGSAVIVDALTHHGAFSGKQLPARLILGRDAQGYVGDALRKWTEDLEAWRSVMQKTDCDDVGT